VFLRRKSLERNLRWQLNIDADAIGVESSFAHQLTAGAGNNFEVDIAAELLFNPQYFRHSNHPFHRYIRTLHNRRA